MSVHSPAPAVVNDKQLVTDQLIDSKSDINQSIIPENTLSATSLLYQSLPAYAAELYDSLLPGDVYFAGTPSVLVSHNSYTLSGIDCIQLCKCIDELRINKLTDTPEYRTLLGILQSCATQQQHALQQWRLKLLNSIYNHNIIIDNSHYNNKISKISPQLAQSELTAASVPWSIRTVLDRDLSGSIHLLSHRQQQQLLIQIKASSYLLQNRPLPDIVLDGIRSGDEISDTLHQLHCIQSDSHTNANKNKESTLNKSLTQLYNKQDNLCQQITGGRPIEPISSLLDAWVGKIQPVQIPYNMIRYERDTYVKQSIQYKQKQLNQYIYHNYTQYGELVPDYLRKQQLQHNLIELQQRVRRNIISSLPYDSITNQRYRNQRQIENDIKQRIKKQKSQKQLLDKSERLYRSNYTKSILSHCRNLFDYHMKRRMTAKKLNESVCKQIELNIRKSEDYKQRQEKQRLQALRENNEEEYVKLLKEAKNNRLLHLLEQTDSYMMKLSQHISAEQQKQHEHQLNEQLYSTMELHDDADDMNHNNNEGEKKKNKFSYVRLNAPALVVSNDGTNQLQYNNDANNVSTNTNTAVTADVSDSTSLEYLMNSRKRYYENAHKIQESVTAQPRCMKFGQLRQYQLDGLKWLISLSNNNLNGILADEMGLGKTVQSISLLAYLMETKQNYGPFLIIAPMSTLHNNWAYEFQRWLPDAKVVIYDGNKSERKLLRDKYILPGEFNVLLTTFEYSMRDTILRKIQWKYIIIDEAHRLKNSKCKLANELNKYSMNSKRLALTGTPLQNDLPELWNLLNFLHPSIFNSTGSFDQFILADQSELNEEEQLLIVNRLHSILRPFMLRREKKQVETDMPDKIEKIIHCKLTYPQQVLYDIICENNISIHNKIMQLRKVCNHLLLFHPFVRNINHSTSYDDNINYIKLSGKFQILDQILPKLFITKHRILIFNQMTKCMDILDSYLQYRGYKYLRLDGMTDAGLRKKNLELFNEKNSDYYIFILSTKAGGLGLNLQTSDTVILFDSDWNPQQDLQAMARAHRIGQKNQVLILRLVSEGTIEEKVLKTAHNKLQNEMMVVRAGMFHSEFSEGKSREMVQQVMVEKASTHSVDNENQCERNESISKIIARTDLELELFLDIDQTNGIKYQPFNNSNQIVPVWLTDYCVRGNKATSCDETLTQYNVELIKHARSNIESHFNHIDTIRHTNNNKLKDPLYYLTDKQYHINSKSVVEDDPFIPLHEQYVMRQKWIDMMSLPDHELKQLIQNAQVKLEQNDANKQSFDSINNKNNQIKMSASESQLNELVHDTISNNDNDSESDTDTVNTNDIDNDDNTNNTKQINGKRKNTVTSKPNNKIKLKRVKMK